ncbi:hypothetical protein ACFIQF_22585 [Comamonas sp. J-3]|uniref:hypothetical protein n=1 Tax=Comamonas trifloxystrobinivorans TaxID=3350256 RepID=UPI00372CBE5C
MRGFQPAAKKAQKSENSGEARGFKGGGPVRGPGTGTSDEVQDEVPNGTYIMPADSTQAMGEQQLASMGKGGVPVNLSNGEFKMPPEQVHAVGVQVLDQMKNATHTPVAARGFAPGAVQPEEPRMFFANGGVVDEEKKRANSFGDAAATTGAMQAPTAAAPAPVQPASAAPSPSNTFPGNRTQGSSGFSGAPAPPPVPAPAPSVETQMNAIAAKGEQSYGGYGSSDPAKGLAPQAPAELSYAANTQSVRDQVHDSWNKGQYGLAAGQAVAGGVGTVTTPLIDGAVKAGSAVGDAASAAWGGIKGFGRGLVGSSAAPAPAAPVVAAAPAAAAPAPAAVTAPPPVAAAPAPAPKPVPPPVAPPAPESNQVLPGVYRNGNSYGDTAAAAAAGAQPRGLPSAQNMAAADALAQRSEQESVARIASGQTARGFAVAPAQPQAGWSGVIGSDPAAGRERKEMIDRLTTPHKGSPNGQLTLGQLNALNNLYDREARTAQAEANNATSLQQTQMQGDTSRDVTGMREAGDMSRAAMREAGENARWGARNAIDQGRLGLEQQVRGFDIRSAERTEKLHQKYEAAKTPEEKSAIAQQIRDLSGKQTESPWKLQVTPSTKNLDGSTSEGSIYRYNGQTGAVERVDAGVSQQKPQVPIEQNPEAIAIHKNASMSNEQKREALQRLGY